MDTITQLDKLLKSASKITDVQAKEAARLLLSLFAETQDKSSIADYIMKFKPTVSLFFFEAAVKTLDSETQMQSIHSAICSSEAYKKNYNNVATSRGFVFAAVLIKNGVNIARDVLMRTLVDAEKDGRFSDSVISLFKKHVLDYCGSLQSILALGETPWDNSASRNRFFRFMDAVNSSTVKIISPAKTQEKSAATIAPPVEIPNEPAATSTIRPPVKTQNEPSAATAPVAPDVSAPLTKGEGQQVAGIPASDAMEKLAEELLRLLSSASKEANTLLQTLSDSNGTISLLRKEIVERDTRIAVLATNLREKDDAIADLRRKLNESQQSERENEGQIADLSERLRNSLQMDSISQSQELITLKTNLQNGLKVEYADYLIGKESECSENNYGALIDNLARIFKTLRRFGITIE